MSEMRDRAELAAQVYTNILLNTESFEVDNIGSDLAYLMGAILRQTEVTFKTSDALYKLLRTHYPNPEQAIWGYIGVDRQEPC